MGPAATTDGRILRSERSRDAIASAVYDLIGEGIPQPTAEQVAERAGVGVRSVFRHFADMDALYATINDRVLDTVQPMLNEAPPAGMALTDRAKQLVADRAVLFERIAPYRRCSNLMRSRSSFLTEENQRVTRYFRKVLLAWLPELENAPNEIVDAIDMATSSEAWDRLRSDQRLGRTRSEAATLQMVLALLRQLEDDA